MHFFSHRDIGVGKYVDGVRLALILAVLLGILAPSAWAAPNCPCRDHFPILSNAQDFTKTATKMATELKYEVARAPEREREREREMKLLSAREIEDEKQFWRESLRKSKSFTAQNIARAERDLRAADKLLLETQDRLLNCESARNDPYTSECEYEVTILKKAIKLLKDFLETANRVLPSETSSNAAAPGSSTAVGRPVSNASSRIRFQENNFTRAKMMLAACRHKDVNTQRELKSKWWRLPTDSQGDVQDLLEELDPACFQTFARLKPGKSSGMPSKP